MAATPFDVAEGRLSILEPSLSLFLSFFPYFRIKRRQEKRRWRRSVCTVLSFLSWPSFHLFISRSIPYHHFIFFLNFFRFIVSMLFHSPFVPLIYGSLSPRRVARFLFTMARSRPVEWRTAAALFQMWTETTEAFPSPSLRAEENFWSDRFVVSC